LKPFKSQPMTIGVTAAELDDEEDSLEDEEEEDELK
jgi:hypothetical protein